MSNLSDIVVQARSVMDTEKVRTGTADIDQLLLGGDLANKLTNEFTETSHKSLPTSEAMFKLLEFLQGLIRQIDPNENIFKDNSVLTSALMPLDFRPDDEKWLMSGWYPSNYKAVFIGPEANNYLKIPSDHIPYNGKYFLVLDIARVDSGWLDVRDKYGATIKSFNTAEKHYMEVPVTNSEIDLFTFVARNVYDGDLIEVRSIGFYFVTPRISDYLLYKIAQVTSGGEGGFVTSDQLSAAIYQLTQDLKNYVDTVMNNDLGQILTHISATGNIHNATPEDIGAAPGQHNHTPAECGAAPVDHSHTPQEIGAAPEQHNHTPEECGAAPVDHDHTPSEVGLGNLPNAKSDAVDLDSSDVLATSKAITTTYTKAAAAFDLASTKADIDHTHTPEEIGAVSPEQVVSMVDQMIKESVSTVPSMTVTDAPVGVFPQGMDSGSMTPPSCILLQGFVEHQTETHFSYEDGYITASKATLETHPLYMAIKKPYTLDEYMNQVAAFEASANILPRPVDLNYQMHIKRTITHYKVGVDRSGTIKGKPTKWDLYVNDVLVLANVAADWSQPGVEELTFPIPELSQVVQRFTLVVKEVSLNGGTSWGIRLDPIFGDVTPDQIGIPANLWLASSDEGRTRLGQATTDLMTVTPTIKREDTPLYVYVDINDDGSINLLNTTHIRPEEGVARYGVSMMDDKFTTGSHPVWGSLLATDTVVGFDVFHIFSTAQDSQGWKTNEGITNATITHQFVENMAIMGYSLEFLGKETDPDNIPGGWDLVVILKDDSELTIDTVSRYSPSVDNGFTTNAHYSKTLDAPVSDVKGYKLVLRSNGRGHGIGIKHLSLRLTKDYYSIPNGTTYNEDGLSINRMYLGFAEYVNKTAYGWSGFDVKPTIIGKTALLPVNEFAICDYNQVYQVPNPFLTKDVSASIEAIKMSGGGLTPMAEIISLTEEYIQIQVLTEDIFRLRLSRNW